MSKLPLQEKKNEVLACNPFRGRKYLVKSLILNQESIKETSKVTHPHNWNISSLPFLLHHSSYNQQPQDTMIKMFEERLNHKLSPLGSLFPVKNSRTSQRFQKSLWWKCMRKNRFEKFLNCWFFSITKLPWRRLMTSQVLRNILPFLTLLEITFLSFLSYDVSF